jgi:hypothetical protein
MTERERFERWFKNSGWAGPITSVVAEDAWQASRRWIPVEERLPDESVPVWAYLPDIGQPVILSLEEEGDEGELAWCKGQHLFWYDKDLKVWACDPDFDDEYRPTHWQPLPEPPEDYQP